MFNIGTVRRILRHKISCAIRGQRLWHRITQKYDPKRESVAVLMPTLSHSYNYHALLYLDQLIENIGKKSAIVLSPDQSAVAAAQFFSERIRKAMVITDKQAEQLMCFYTIFPYDFLFFVASLNEPYGRTGDKIVGKNGTTVGELMALGVFKLPEFRKEIPPTYQGDDEQISRFLDTKEFDEYGA